MSQWIFLYGKGNKGKFSLQQQGIADIVSFHPCLKSWFLLLQLLQDQQVRVDLLEMAGENVNSFQTSI